MTAFLDHYRGDKAGSVADRPHVVYLFQAGPFIKFGITSNLSRREKTLQTGCPYRMRLMRKVDCYDQGDAAQIESELLTRTAAERTDGGVEWRTTDLDEASALMDEVVAYLDSPVVSTGRARYWLRRHLTVRAARAVRATRKGLEVVGAGTAVLAAVCAAPVVVEVWRWLL